jgi:ATP-binding cassette subfamily B (MDR/TAP) protein 1
MAPLSRYMQLFFTADYFDISLMILGSLGAMFYGASVPLLHILNGRVINEVYETSSNLQQRINSLCVIYCYVGFGAIIGGLLQVSCWTYAGERQTGRLQDKYIRAVLAQDISWFDNVGGRKLGTEVRERINNINGIRHLH